ncbi:histone-lysine N-methyltransferase PRDM9-like isoform X1 [Takifugu rubripes]|uniref:histone-lysine N-methyltransferase PRDM9-like isoform X1 n=1 Tax=Takifugu rubripes TaxID=31033 RepID=UPI0011453E81|nr:histone-lysine N-methyltransferase PRDM9-like isoform X1 [Takifugu rubripes]
MLLSIDQDHDPSEYLTLDLNLDDSLQKTLAIMSVMNSEESEPNLQLFSHSTHEDSNHKGDQQNDSGSTLRKQNHPQHKDFQGQHFVMCKEEDGEVLINQGHWNTERNAGLDPEDTKPQHMKEEHLRITAEEVVLKQETDASLSPPSSEVYREVQTLNPDKTTKQSVTKLPLLNPVMSEPNSDPLLLLSTSCREDKVIGQRKTRRGGSRSTKQDKNITQPRQRAGKRHAKDVQKPSKLIRNCNSDRGEKSLKCDTCGKRFKFKSTLHIHIRIHTGEKPYVCKTCGKSFTQQGHLSSHILIHTGEKPYVCLTCKKGFLRKKSLRDHMTIHTGLQPHVCVTCEKGFILKKDFTAHIRTHNAEKHTR